MASFNRVILMGNLTRDPQVKYIPSGSAVTEIGLAVNRTWYDKNTNQKKEEVTFVEVTLWGRQAEIAGEYLSKGRSVLIEGRLQLDTWQDKETGQNRSKLRVVCENMTMVGGRPDGGQGGGGGSYQKPQSSSSPQAANSANNHEEYSPNTSSPADDFYNPGDSGEDVPF
jgi:single-strand DNA-binding protein